MNKRPIRNLAATLMLTAAISLSSAFLVFAADQDIIILNTNDVHCGVEDNIGYAGLALYEKEMKQQTPYVMLVDAGDSIQGAPIGTLSDGGYLVDIMNEMGYDFAIPGNHEFDYGMARFLELAGKLDCGYTSCNFTSLQTGSLVFPAYRMFTYDDTDVAMVGVTTPESFTKSSPAYFQDGAGNYIYGFCEDATGAALYNAVQSAVDSARAAGAEYVIVVGHLGNEGVHQQWSSEAVIANTNGIDAFIDGPTHETYTKTFNNKDGAAVPVIQTGTKLSSIGKITIKTDGSISTELVTEIPADANVGSAYVVQKGDSLNRIAKRMLGSYDLWTVVYDANRAQISNPNIITPGMVLTIPGGSVVTEDGRNVDAYMQAYIDGIESQYEASLATVLGHTSVDLTTLDPATGQRAVRKAETNLGDLCADAYRIQTGADIGIQNGGGIRADIKAGNITYNDTLSVFPYGNMVCVAEVTGQQIKDCLEMGVRNYPEESGGFQHVSGLTYTVDSSIPSSVTTDDQGNFTGVTGAYRVTEILVGGEPLDVNKTYTLASHNYLLKDGGDGMNMFMGTNIIRDEVSTDVDMLSAYINENLGGTVGAEYADPHGQGRITIK